MRDTWVYILHCADGSYYTGVTSDVGVRVAEHHAGITDCWTFHRRPVRLVYSACFPSPLDAIRFEKRIKGWSRAKKEALMRGDWMLLKELARSGSRASTSSAGRGRPSTSSG